MNCSVLFYFIILYIILAIYLMINCIFNTMFIKVFNHTQSVSFIFFYRFRPILTHVTSYLSADQPVRLVIINFSVSDRLIYNKHMTVRFNVQAQ
jgi:hypothetical protein